MIKQVLVGIAAITMVLTLTPPVGAEAEVELYDTAWHLPAGAAMHEVDTYFAHLSESGYTGTWISLVDIVGDGVNIDGHRIINWEGDSYWLDEQHMRRVQEILGKARHHGIKVGVAPSWGLNTLHANIERGCKSGGEHAGPLNHATAYGYGKSIGQWLSGYTEVIGMWIAGGDNFCARGDGAIWEKMVSGLRDGSQNWDIPVGFHTPAIEGRHTDFMRETWVDLQLPQTGHCESAAAAGAILQSVVQQTDKPVYAAELRYHGIQPEWDCPLHGTDKPVKAHHVRKDIAAALAAGVQGVAYGENGRWQWGVPSHGAAPGAMLSELNGAGEEALFEALGASAPLPPEMIAPPSSDAEPGSGALPTPDLERPPSSDSADDCARKRDVNPATPDKQVRKAMKEAIEEGQCFPLSTIQEAVAYFAGYGAEERAANIPPSLGESEAEELDESEFFEPTSPEDTSSVAVSDTAEKQSVLLSIMGIIIILILILFAIRSIYKNNKQTKEMEQYTHHE